MKRLLIALGLFSIIALAALHWLRESSGTSSGLTVTVVNQSDRSFHGSIRLNDDLVLHKLDIPGHSNESFELSMKFIHRWLDSQNSTTGRLSVSYETEEHKDSVELFGYIPRGDDFLNGREITVTQPEDGVPQVFLKPKI
ncbi:MAG: hypothetical protein HRU19_26660 [Pseudobacteriovorax sp.]|nr:hypothetical protein [Pseudobacteriovorax sp.]